MKSPLQAAQRYINEHLPELSAMPLAIHQLDGPPGSPRYVVTSEACCARACPHGFSADVATSGQCDVRDCPLRRSARLLLDREGVVVHVTLCGIHWNERR